MSGLSTSRVYFREYDRKRKEHRAAAGLCPRCGKSPRPADYSTCDACRARDKARRTPAVLAQRVRQRQNDKRLAITHCGGCCAVCGEQELPFLNIDHIEPCGSHGRIRGLATWLRVRGFPDGYQVLCWNHNYLKWLRDTRSKWSTEPKATKLRAKYAKLRLAVLRAYSGERLRCCCCGVEDVDLLTLDHVNGGGNKHRQEVSGRHFSHSWRYYRHLRAAGYPPGYQVLCHNCNSGRAVNGGVCPHQEKLKQEIS